MDTFVYHHSGLLFERSSTARARGVELSHARRSGDVVQMCSSLLYTKLQSRYLDLDILD